MGGEAARAFDSFLGVGFCAGSAGDGGIVAGNFGLRKRGIAMSVEGRINPIIDIKDHEDNRQRDLGAWDYLGNFDRI